MFLTPPSEHHQHLTLNPQPLTHQQNTFVKHFFLLITIHRVISDFFYFSFSNRYSAFKVLDKQYKCFHQTK